MKPLLLFDVDGTLTESGKNLDLEMIDKLTKLEKYYDLGIVGGGKFEKIYEQINNIKIFTHIFSECGCVYHKLNLAKNYEIIYTKKIRNHLEYSNINKLIKLCLKFLSEVDYNITGNFIDLRNGIIYVSLIGMSANEDERKFFIEIDKKQFIRKKLIEILKEETKRLKTENIQILEGGSVGIGIYPKEYGKLQVLQVLNNYLESSSISYFGDKYTEEGNDYELITNSKVKGYPVDNQNDTKNILDSLLNNELIN